MPCLLALLKLLRDEGEGDLGHLPPAVINDEGVPPTRHLAELGDGRIVLLQLERRLDDRRRDRMVLLAMSRSGPRSRFLLLTWSSVHGLRLAAAWKSGVPDPGTAYRS